jgi:Fe-S-cluster containining protein
MIEAPIGHVPEGVLVGSRTLLRLVEQQQNAMAQAGKTAQAVQRERHIFERHVEGESILRVAELMHKRVDRAMVKQDMRQPSGPAQVTCTRYCNHCCFQLVSVSEPEALLALDAARRVGHVIDGERVRKQAAIDGPYGGALPHADRRCVMLKDDGDCAIYHDRPTACRTYRVVSPPEHCNEDKYPGHGTLALATTDAEVIGSASTLLFRHGPLAEFIAEHL